jgi:hypothetical protein
MCLRAFGGPKGCPNTWPKALVCIFAAGRKMPTRNYKSLLGDANTRFGALAVTDMAKESKTLGLNLFL